MSEASGSLETLVPALGEEETLQLAQRLAECLPRHGDLVTLLQDDAACLGVVAAIKELTTMPDGAAVRWGERVASHKCAHPMSCLVGLARNEPDSLDKLHQRLIDAKEYSEGVARREACVPSRKKGKLAHVEGDGRAQSAFQAQQEREEQAPAAAAAAVAADGVDAAQCTACEQETPEVAAQSVRNALAQQGCCVRAQTAFCHACMGVRASRLLRLRHRSPAPPMQHAAWRADTVTLTVYA